MDTDIDEEQVNNVERKTSNKKFWSYLRSLRTEGKGVSALKQDGKLNSDSKDKATVLNNQFVSVFTRDPDTPPPDLGPSPHPTMEEIEVTENGVLKMRSHLKDHKAAGPDNISAKHRDTVTLSYC